MEDAQIVLERHEQQIKSLERDISDLKAVQTEIRTMNETLVTLATELKHTNEEDYETYVDTLINEANGELNNVAASSDIFEFSCDTKY